MAKQAGSAVGSCKAECVERPDRKVDSEKSRSSWQWGALSCCRCEIDVVRTVYFTRCG